MRTLSLLLSSVLFSATLLLAGTVSAQQTAEAPSDNNTAQELRQLMQLAEYIGVDYVEAVANGKIINADEYAEMQEFAEILLQRGQQLPQSGESAAIHQQALALQAAIERRAEPVEIQQYTAKLRESLLIISPQLSLPGELLATADSAALYQSHCIACHGVSGQGDGPLAAQLEPAPTNFHEVERAKNRSLLGLYDAISNGIDGTAMASFASLTEQQRWSLAFYVGSLAFTGAEAADSNLSLQDLVKYSPNVLRSNDTQITDQQNASLRADPAPLFAKSGITNNPDNAMDVARERLQQALEAYQQGDYNQSRTLAISAYLDGFELVEGQLDSHDSALRKSIERDLLSLRAKLNTNSDPEQVVKELDAVLQRLEQAQNLLEGSQLSSGALFIASLIILLREGLEALLVVIALGTILIKTQRRDALKYVHIGWIGAFAAGFLTWLLAQKLITISGASREVMEGVAAALAAAVLFYVGFWMHSKTNAQEWQKYIQQSISRSLTAGTLWGIAGLSFIAVYREIFETILFYQSLLSQTASSQFGALWGGMAAGVAALALIGWLMVRYSARLPIGKFFSTTTFILLALSFVLAGKAVAALQEAALIGMHHLPVNFSFEWLGIYPTWEGIAVQLAILLASGLILFRGRTPVNSIDVASKPAS